jgi:DMSO/TMAO reductase YedYZ molybdopterin-dependent catalytic subunit
MNTEAELKRAGGAGFISALVMVGAQLVWRSLDSKDNVVQSFPEFIATAIARLTPLSVFGSVTENYGSWAKRTLLAACVIGIVAVGVWAGRQAYRIAGPPHPSFTRRLFGGAVIATALLAVTLFVILPVANLGIAARSSSYTSDILTQLIVTFALFAVVFATISGEPVPTLASDGETYSRRTVAVAGSWSVLGLAGLGASSLSLVHLFRSRHLSSAEAAAQEEAVDQIVATQTSASPVAGQSLFEQMEAEGNLTSRLTATKDFYHVSKNFSDPTVSSDGWSLEISGDVTTPQTYTLEQLTARATTKNITTLCCVSNEINGDLISTAEWTGIPLRDLLAEAGISASAVDLKCSAADDYSDSFPASVAQDPSVLVVVGMNGETLPDDHGYPARLIVPPIYGMKNVKWLKKIEVVDSNYQGYWQERGWSDLATYQIWGRIDFPTRDKIAAGPAIICGVASAGNRDIKRVEVSLDSGATWTDAQLEPSLNPPFTWVRWALPFTAATGDYHVVIRATDGTGAVMSETDRAPLPDGATGWPRRTIHVA